MEAERLYRTVGKHGKTADFLLTAMRADMIDHCIVNTPATAAILQGARQGGAITSRALEILISELRSRRHERMGRLSS
jgi:hypothetical protein